MKPGNFSHIVCDHCGFIDIDEETTPEILKKDGDQAGWSCPACGIVHMITLSVEYSFRCVPGYHREFGIAV